MLLVGLAQLLGYLFTRLRQPEVVGEILAGILLGPAVFGRLRFGTATLADLTTHHATILNFVYWLGLLLLMFLSGAEARELFTREERREVSWLAIVGTGIPFLLALGLGPWLARPELAVSLAGRLAGFRGLDLVNLALTTNARGGPGIVLASVALDAGIISNGFYTTLVLAAVITSQIAGAWLDCVLHKGWPLLSEFKASSPSRSNLSPP